MSEQTKKEEKTTNVFQVNLPNELCKEAIDSAERKDNEDRKEREAIRIADQVEKKRKEDVDIKTQKEARDRAEKVLEDYKKTFRCSCSSPLMLKKIALVLLVIVEIIVLTCWVHHPVELEFNKLIAPILFVTIIFSLILILGNVIAKEDREIAKARSEIMKEIFMRRLK